MSDGPRRRLSRAGLIAAALYMAGGAALIYDDLAHSTGGWINLKGMVTGLVVLPVAWPAEVLHLPFKSANPYHAVAALLACAWLVYWCVAGVAAFVGGLRAPRG